MNNIRASNIDLFPTTPVSGYSKKLDNRLSTGQHPADSIVCFVNMHPLDSAIIQYSKNQGLAFVVSSAHLNCSRNLTKY